MTSAPRFRQTFAPIPGHGARFTTLVRSLTDEELAATVPGMTWTAADVAAHVLTVLRRYRGNPERSASRQQLTDQNDAEVRALELSPAEIADAIDAWMATMSERAPHLPLDRTAEFHLGLTIDVAGGWANLCSELLVHGTDIARATGRTWEFPEADVEGIWRNLFPALTGWLRVEAREIDEVYELRFGFGPVSLWIHDGRVTVDDAVRAPDHVIDVDDAAAFTLAVPWRRALVVDPGAALLLSRFHEV